MKLNQSKNNANIYASRQLLGEELKDFLFSNEVISLLPHCGWLDGGCRSLMKALQLWLGEENAQPFQLVKDITQEHSEHALVKVGKYFIDGDGISTYTEVYTRWFIEEGFSKVFIKPFNPTTEPPHITSSNVEEPYYIEDESINKLVTLLDNHFQKELLLQLLQSD